MATPLPSALGIPRGMRSLFLALGVAAIAACPSEGGGTFQVSAQVTGLEGRGLTLSFNGAAPVAVSANGVLLLAQGLQSGDAFEVAVAHQPSEPHQTCTPQGGSGRVASVDVVVQVVCTSDTYAVEVEVTGLAGQGLSLSLGEGNRLEVVTNGVVAFPTRLASGSRYQVVLLAPPTSPWQECILERASGTIVDSDVSVGVTCSILQLSVVAEVSGLRGRGLRLLNNGADSLAPRDDGVHPFPQLVMSGEPYQVTVDAQPTSPWQTCVVSDPGGTVQGADVTVPVSCSTNSYSVKGSVSGLAGGMVQLANNGATPVEVVTDGAFSFPGKVESGQRYEVTIVEQPENRLCVVNDGQGTVAGEDVEDITVVCSGVLNTTPPAISGEALVFAALAATPGVWAGAPDPVFAYQWQRCDAAGAGCADRPGATGAGYTAVAADFGHTLRVRVTASADGESVAAESEPTSVIGEPTCANPQTLAAHLPGVAQSVPASLSWENAELVFVDDGAVATAGPIGPGEYTDLLEIRGFGFTLPTSAKIEHIQIDVERSSTGGLLTDHVVEIRTVESGSANLAKAAERWSSAGEVASYGGPGSNLGASFPTSSVNAESFAVRIAARNDGLAGVDEAHVDRVTVTVTYLAASLAGPYTATQLASVEDPAVAIEAAWSPLTASLLESVDGAFIETGDFAANGKSEWLVATGFGVALPANANPTGVIVEVVRQATVFDWAIHTETATLVKGGSMDAATWTEESLYEWVKAPEWQTASFGDATDLWRGASLTAADVTDPGFGVAMRLRASIGSAVAGMHGRFDSLRLWVASDPVERVASSTATVAAQERVGQTWHDPDNIKASDGAEAWTQLVDGWASDFLRASGFGFDVPAEAWVRGISVDVTRRALSGYMADRIVRLAGVPAASENRAHPMTSAWENSLVTQSYGGPTDRWGAGYIEPSAINDPSFAADFSAAYRITAGNDLGYVDSIAAGVTYCMP